MFIELIFTDLSSMRVDKVDNLMKKSLQFVLGRMTRSLLVTLLNGVKDI